MKQRSNVMFADESCFSIRPKKNFLHVCRRMGTKLRQKLNASTLKFEYQTISVWDCFSLYRRSPLVWAIGSFDQHTYSVIIDNHALTFVYHAHGGSNAFVLQDENCGPHMVKSIATYLDEEEIALMKWPPSISGSKSN